MKSAFFAAIQIDLLRQVAVVAGVMCFAGVAMFLGHGAWSGPATRRNTTRLARGRTALQSVLDGSGTEAHHRQLAALPRRLQVQVLVGVASSLAGEQRLRLTTLAADLGLLEWADARCRSRLWWRRLHGARLYTLLGEGGASVPALLRDRRPEVRSQAAQWVVEHHDDNLVDLLLEMLDNDDGSSRFWMQDSLIRIGRPLVERLASHLSSRSGPSLVRALEVAVAVADPDLLPAALSLCDDATPRIRALAAGLAGAIGGSSAIDALRGLLADEAPEVRAAAARALGRAANWPSAGALAGLLGDESWDVRLQAAVALRALGSPGILLLRRALASRDAFAADAARHLLDLPESAMRTL